MWLPLTSRTRRIGVSAEPLGDDSADPGPGGVDERARARPSRCAPVAQSRSVDRQSAVARARADTTSVRVSMIRAALRRVDGVQDDEARIVDPAVGIFEAARELRLQRLARRVARQVERARRRQELAPAEMVVEEEAEPDQPGRPQAL